MGSIATANLMVEGIGGLGEVLSFTFSQLPGEHARASIQAVEADRVKERGLGEQWIRGLARGQSRPFFCGRLQKLWEEDKKGFHQVILELASGTILMDQKKKSHYYKEVTMSYRKLLEQVARQGEYLP